MEPLNNEKVYTFQSESAELLALKGGLPVAEKPGLKVSSYKDLLRKIAELQFHNRRFRLLFRGQQKDHDTPNNKGKKAPAYRSSLYPSILRGEAGKLKTELLPNRFEVLKKADEKLKSISSDREIHKHRLIRWAMLQHYEVCPTPLLDVTYSLDVALSFASLTSNVEGYLFVLAIPQTTGPISIALDSGTQVVDLQQFCPPDILRPHFQNGCLIGDYPIIESAADSQGGKGLLANNFACRLLAKFRLTELDDWSNEGFQPKSQSILFPNDTDPWFSKMNSIKSAVAK